MAELILDRAQIEKIAEDYRRDGISHDLTMPDGMIEGIRTHLDSCRQFIGHVKANGERDSSFSQRCYEMPDVINAPGFFAFALKLAPLARLILEVEVPRLYSLNAFWTFPYNFDKALNYNFHTDNDDVRQMAMFVFGTDVLKDENGPHVFQCRNGHEQTVYGSKGSLFISDPSRMHKGLLPKTAPRLLLWARWGVSNPPSAYTADHLSPVPKDRVLDYPDDPWLRECVRLVAN